MNAFANALDAIGFLLFGFVFVVWTAELYTEMRKKWVKSSRFLRIQSVFFLLFSPLGSAFMVFQFLEALSLVLRVLAATR